MQGTIDLTCQLQAPSESMLYRRHLSCFLVQDRAFEHAAQGHSDAIMRNTHLEKPAILLRVLGSWLPMIVVPFHSVPWKAEVSSPLAA